MGFAYSKGIIFTIEAFLSFLVLLSLLSLFPLFYETGSNLYKFVYLQDIFEVFEKGYHDELADWIDNGNVDARLEKFFENVKGVYLYYEKKQIPKINCTEDIKIKRFVVTSKPLYEGAGKWHVVTLVLCSKH